MAALDPIAISQLNKWVQEVHGTMLLAIEYLCQTSMEEQLLSSLQQNNCLIFITEPPAVIPQGTGFACVT